MAQTNNIMLQKPDVSSTLTNTNTMIGAAFDTLDAFIAGRLTKDVSGSTDTTLTQSESCQMIHQFTGALTGSKNVIVTPHNKIWLVVNSTTGNYSLTIKTATGNGIVLPQGAVTMLDCDQSTIGGITSAIGMRQAINACVDFGAPRATSTPSTSSQSAIQNAINSAAFFGSKEVYIPAGVWLVSGLTLNGGITLVGDGFGANGTILYSTSNATILNCGRNSGATGIDAYVGPTVKNMRIRGLTGAGSSQLGVKIDDASSYCLGVHLDHVWVENTGGRGLYWGLAYNTLLTNCHFDNCQGTPLVYDAPGMPGNKIDTIYVHGIVASAPVSMRIKRGDLAINNYNGVDNILADSACFALGKKSGIDGDTGNAGSNVVFTDCNFEVCKGIISYYSSVFSLTGQCRFVPGNITTTLNGALTNNATTITVTSTTNFDTTGTLLIDSERIPYTGKTSTTFTGCTRGGEGSTAATHSTGATVTMAKNSIEFDLANDQSDYFAEFIQRGVVDDSVLWSAGPKTAYRQSTPIRANGFAPLQTNGNGPFVASDSPLATYYNVTASALSYLARADSRAPIVTVTTTTSFLKPGVRFIAVNHSSGTPTITLPWAGYYKVGEPVVVYDASGAAATRNITVNSLPGGGGTVNGASSYTISTNKQAVTFWPDGSNNWIVGGKGSTGSTGSFTAGANTVTVANGIITSIT